MDKNNDNNKYANKILYVFLFIGIIPLVVVFGIYLHEPTSQALIYITDKVNNLPAVTSAANPLMTKVMDVYCKTAPILAIILFFVSIGKRKIVTTLDKGKLIRACLLSPFFYVFYIYMFLFRNLELTTAGRPVRLMSENNSLLLLLYICLYASVFVLTYAMCYAIIITWKLIKERQ